MRGQPSLIDANCFNKTLFGKKVQLFTLKNKEGIAAQITNYGGRLVGLWTPDNQGNFEDIVLGYNKLEDYLKSKENYYGALIGRYGNRICNASFSLNGKQYKLKPNDSGNHLHGGLNGFHNVVWDAKKITGQQLELRYKSRDGEEGYPGNLDVVVTYTLTDINELRIEYTAKTDAPTLINLTQHSYFNLQGAGNGTITDHILKINADYYIPVDKSQIPLGRLEAVKNTPMDFSSYKSIGQNIDEDFKQLRFCNGYDHCWVLNKQNKDLVKAAEVFEPKGGRKMEVYTNEPGLQFYTSNTLADALNGKNNKKYGFRGGLCLETQHYPDSPNQENFPKTILKPNEVYNSTCIYRFEVI